MKKISAVAVLIIFILFSSCRTSIFVPHGDFSRISADISPGIVLITSTGQSTDSENLWHNYFEKPESGSEVFPFSDIGSGIIVAYNENSCYVLTNNHVIENYNEITVKTKGSGEFSAELAGNDRNHDLALLKIDNIIRSEMPEEVKMGDSDLVRVGEWVLAIGNPLGYESSVTHGIISAISRFGGPDDNNISDFIQTDAPINRGNSGGALVNIKGEVIGINTWIAAPSGGSVGLGFSVPSNNARKFIKDILRFGRLRKAWLGLILEDSEDGSIVVSNVYSQSPSDGKLFPGDTILKIGKRKVSTVQEARQAVSLTSPGDKIKILVNHNGISDFLTLDAHMYTEERPPSSLLVKPGFSTIWKNDSLVVGDVIARSNAHHSGLVKGDIIISVNNSVMESKKHFYDALNKDRKYHIKIRRNDETQTIIIHGDDK